MLNNKNVLIALLSLILYLNIYIPLESSNSKNISKLSLFKKKLKSEQEFLKNQKKVKIYIMNAKEIISNNSKLFYQGKLQNSMLYNNMQKKVNSITKNIDGKVINVIWGEPYDSSNKRYVSLPFTLIIELKPNMLYRFFNRFQSEKAITIKSFNLIKRRDNLLLNMQIIFYKLN